eukprot:1121991-Rhodomonas_salina.2
MSLMALCWASSCIDNVLADWAVAREQDFPDLEIRPKAEPLQFQIRLSRHSYRNFQQSPGVPPALGVPAGGVGIPTRVPAGAGVGVPAGAGIPKAMRPLGQSGGAQSGGA